MSPCVRAGRSGGKGIFYSKTFDDAISITIYFDTKYIIKMFPILYLKCRLTAIISIITQKH